MPADNDFYRVVAQTTGTLDFQVYFHLYRAALLPAGGNLNLTVLDGAGDVIAAASGGAAAFGAVGGTGDARIRIPAVAGQTYYLHVFGSNPDGTVNPNVVNGYNATVIDTAPPVPNTLELSRSVLSVTIAAGNGGAGYTTVPVVTFSGGGATTQATGVAVISNGQVTGVNITSTGIGYTSPPTVTFTGGGFTTLAVGTAVLNDTGDLPLNSSNSDTGRSQFDNVTRINTPTIFIRVNDGILLNDLPGNGTPDNPPAGVIPIPFQAPASAALGYKVAIFDGNNTQTPIGFATQVDPANFPGLYTFTFTTALADGIHHLTARLEMVDPAVATETGFGGASTSLDITVDTVAPPVFFGPTPGVNGNGLVRLSDSGIPGDLLQAGTLVDRITNATLPTFEGTAEANSIVRLYVIDKNGNRLLIGQTVAHPLRRHQRLPERQLDHYVHGQPRRPGFLQL